MLVTLSELDSTCVPFTVQRINGAKVVWLNLEALNGVSSCEVFPWSEAGFLAKFSYARQGNACFDTISFEPEDEIEVLADRYGGMGIGRNGGGGRTGTIGTFQIKGIGRNPLVGEGGEEWHSYGGQSLIDAVLEAINAAVFDHILPVGTVPCFGIIYTGADTAYMPSNNWEDVRGPGAILVREACLRPAHFLRARNFCVGKGHCDEMPDDVSRTRAVNRQLFERCGGHKELVRHLGEFLSNCANQFAFARVFRISHGVLSPSNITFDGRWLDLTNVTFLDGGKNYASHLDLIPFFDEDKAIVSFLQEFIYTYTKYNRTEFDVQPLIRYYRDQFDAYFDLHMCRVIGLQSEYVGDDQFSSYFSEVAESFKAIVHQNRDLLAGSPVGFNPDDPVLSWLEGIFRSFTSDVTDVPSLARCIRTMFGNAFIKCADVASYRSFVVLCAIQSLKPALFAQFFSRGRIIAYLSKAVRNEAPEFWESFIRTHIEAGKWMFSEWNCQVGTIFSSDSLNIRYEAKSECYVVQTSLYSEVMPLASDVISWLADQDQILTCVEGYQFRPNLERLLTSLSCIELGPAQQLGAANV